MQNGKGHFPTNEKVFHLEVMLRSATTFKHCDEIDQPLIERLLNFLSKMSTEDCLAVIKEMH